MKWGARVLRVRSVSREEVWASAGVQGAWVGGCGCETDKGVFVFVESVATDHSRMTNDVRRMIPIFISRMRNDDG